MFRIHSYSNFSIMCNFIDPYFLSITFDFNFFISPKYSMLIFIVFKICGYLLFICFK